MKVTIVCGSDTEKALARYYKIIDLVRLRNWEIVDLSAEDNMNFQEKLNASSLFPGERLFTIFALAKVQKDDLRWFLKKPKTDHLNLLAYYQGKIPKSTLKLFPKTLRVEKYDLPKLTFVFLESLYPGNAKEAVRLSKKVSQKDPPELIFSLVASRFRELYLMKVDETVLDYPSWRKAKLKKQAFGFSQERVVEIINLLAEADIAAKSSGAKLEELLDHIFLTQLD